MNDRNELLYPREQFYARERRSVPAARRFAAQSLRCWGLADWARAADMSLCVSELATNALLHGVPPGRGFLLRLRYDGEVLRVEVHDSGPGLPTPTEPSDDADEGGRGLLLVGALADKWGVAERELGKVAWAEFEAAREAADGNLSAFVARAIRDQLSTDAMALYVEDSARIGDDLDDLYSAAEDDLCGN